MEHPLTAIVIERALSPTVSVRRLLGELDAVLSAEYTAEQRHGLSVEAIFEPHVRFFVAQLNGANVGCAGVAFFDVYGELKRMYVQPSARGSGVARELLSTIEAQARAAGLSLLRLETGTCQLAAIRLYEGAGFRPCAAFGSYVDMSPEAIRASLFFEKQLTGDPPIAPIRDVRYPD